ncbi:UPF0481 protein At3g47200-like [Neltuma alba]|uniref:UPF0481 protein At3g47200-like n=1 Tax=Neltuma alba TaxID=207710 RepID=UPI0010A4BE7B|nr:UPF0481 protein At3g47200-like [Prosopis alba]
MASDSDCGAKSINECEMVRQIKIDIKGLQEQQEVDTFQHGIYRVQCTLRDLNKEAYTPQLISIGPIHYGQEKLIPMQKQKLRYFHLFWFRVSDDKRMTNFKEFLKNEEQVIRHLYAEEFKEIKSEEFVSMLLLDSVFIMELFLRFSSEEKDKDDPILNQTWLKLSIQRDLMVLENQIPFYILDKLYTTVVPEICQAYERFIDLASEYFKSFDPYARFDPVETLLKPDKDSKISSKSGNNRSANGPKKRYSARLQEHGINNAKHFTDLIRSFYVNDLELKPLPSTNARSATKLREAGVSFEKVKKKKLLCIKFKKHPILSWFLCLGCKPALRCFKARLRTPQFKVDHTTECVLRNLMALEQYHYEDKPYVCNYASLLDSLIHTSDDVELLVEKEVIVHELGSNKEVAVLVNGLCKNVMTKGTCYKRIIDDLNKHYENPWNHTMAALNLVYFRDTWRTSSTVIGIAILIYTMLNFYKLLRGFFS